MKTKLLTIPLFFCLLSFTGMSFPGNTIGNNGVPDWIKYDWTGQGYQIDGNEWAVHLSYDSESRQLKIDYPTLGCSGSWSFDLVDGTFCEGDELITKGEDKCDQGVEIRVKMIDPEHIKVEYYLRWFSDDPIAWSVLERSKQA